MKEDIRFPEVKDVGMAVVYDEKEDKWSAFLLNFKKVALINVIVASKGYGERKGERVKTSVLRHYFERIEEQSATEIEMIPDELINLGNEYWVSFYIGDKIYDKKYVFVSGSISKKNLQSLGLIQNKGILIR